jgi:hypothetical protein
MLREELETLRSGRQAQDDEIEELRTGKKAIEAELEGLSQALFEEANNMVADERRKRAEVEETLREVKEEREALRQTVKVLGGRVQTPLPGTPVGELTEADAMRNLDQPYEALRRGIRHAIDGPSPAPSEAESDDDATPGENAAEADAAAVAAVAAAEVPETRTRSNTVTTLRANGQPAQPMYAAEPNPWD